MRSLEVLMCSDRYAADMPLSFRYLQLPPMPEPFSKQSYSIPLSPSTWHEAIPDEPAPITQTFLPVPSGETPDSGEADLIVV